MSFEGTCRIVYSRPKTRSDGSFKLDCKTSTSADGDTTSSANASVSNLTACLKANTRCLTTCPRGDFDEESLCASSCRTRLQACERKAGKLSASSP